MTYIVYQITCLATGKKYIGQTKQGLMKRWRAHCRKALSNSVNYALSYAIRKHGVENFKLEVLHTVADRETVLQLEIDEIQKRNTITPNGYNLTYGGEGVIPSEEARRKMSEAAKRRTISEEARRKMSEAAKNISDETRRKISEAAKNISDETRRKISEAAKGRTSPYKGKTHSDETRRKLSETLKGRIPPNKGKTASEETRRKMSEARKGKTHSEETRRKLSEATKAWRQRQKLLAAQPH